MEEDSLLCHHFLIKVTLSSYQLIAITQHFLCFEWPDYTRKWAKYLDEEFPSAILSVDYRWALKSNKVFILIDGLPASDWLRTIPIQLL